MEIVVKTYTLLAHTHVAITESGQISQVLAFLSFSRLLWVLLHLRGVLEVDAGVDSRLLVSRLHLFDLLPLHELLLDIHDILVHVVLSLQVLVFVQIGVVVR